jgi:hypothetical protein
VCGLEAVFVVVSIVCIFMASVLAISVIAYFRKGTFETFFVFSCLESIISEPALRGVNLDCRN